MSDNHAAVVRVLYHTRLPGPSGFTGVIRTSCDCCGRPVFIENEDAHLERVASGEFAFCSECDYLPDNVCEAMIEAREAALERGARHPVAYRIWKHEHPEAGPQLPAPDWGHSYQPRERQFVEIGGQD